MVNKITTPPTTSELIGTVNEIIDDKQDKLTSDNAGTDIEITDSADVEIDETVTGDNTITLESAKYDSLASLTLYGKCEQSNLPSEYTQVEYIESEGHQYIDTGLAGNNNYIIKGKFYDFGGGSMTTVVCGSNSRYGTNYIGRISGTGSSYRFLLSNKKCDLPASSGVHEFIVSSEKVIFDGVEYSWVNDNNSIGQKLYLFYGYYSSEHYAKIRLYYCQLRLNDTLLRNFIPARRNSDSALGVYDTVTGNFLTNSGTGTFTAGADVVPTPDNPMDIVCNNGVVKVNSQGQIYTDGTVETIEINTTGNTATAEILLKVGTYQDVQELLTGNVTRNVGIKVLDGTENWQNLSGYMNIIKTDLGTNSTVLPADSTDIFCTHFQVKTDTFVDGVGSGGSYINFKYDSLFTTLTQFKQYLATQYANGTPVILIYPLATATTETVTAQPLTVQQGTNLVTITQASIDTLSLTAEYTKIIQSEGLKISFANDSGYITSSALTPYALTADLATVATTGAYSDLSGTPTIPTVNNATLTITQGGVTKGTFTANASSDVTIEIDEGGGGSGGISYVAGTGISFTDDGYQQNFSVIGSPTISSDYIASNFTVDDYLKLPIKFDVATDPWEMQLKFTTGSSLPVVPILGPSNGIDCQIPLILINGSYLYLLLSSNGSDWNIANTRSSTPFVTTNTTYWVKLIYSGSDYKLYKSTDGSLWDLQITINSSTPIYQPQTVVPGIGINKWSSNPSNWNAFNGTVDLKECYIKINDVDFWRAFTTKTAINCTLTAGTGIDITSDVISVEGVKDQRNTSTAIKTWTGTRAQYDSIVTKDSNTLYNITDTGEIYLGSTLLSNYGADTSLSNLTSTGKNIANWSNNVTNCITEIPQDIKLELNNGTLTLKAGSKVYIPNGFEVDGTTPKFDVVTIDSDKNVSIGTFSGQSMVFYKGSAWGNNPISNILSGTTVPSSFTGMFYKTDTNILDYYANSTAEGSKFSLPLALITQSGGQCTSIDQLFNGFGYIGSTYFALTGIKGLIPNGRNTDGTLKNIEITNSSVQTFTISGTPTFSGYCLRLSSNALNITNMYYDEINNLNIHNNGAVLQSVIIGTSSVTSGSITFLTPKTAFHALDYNDSSTISGWSMPSSRYIDLTLGASGTTYTAPANGWLLLQKEANAANQSIQFINDGAGGLGMTAIRSNTSGSIAAFCPAKKGNNIRCYYSAGGTTNRFMYIYAEGEN